MKNTFRSLFKFLLEPLEKGDEEFNTNPLARKVLIVISSLFLFLGCSVLVIFLKISSSDLAYLIPSVVFITAGLLGLIISILGTDRAIAKIWGNQ